MQTIMASQIEANDVILTTTPRYRGPEFRVVTAENLYNGNVRIVGEGTGPANLPATLIAPAAKLYNIERAEQ